VTDTSVRPDVVPVDVDDPDREKFSHIVYPADAVTEAYITGATVTALCGKTWVPTRDPKRYPVCPTCKDVQADWILGSRGYEPRT